MLMDASSPSFSSDKPRPAACTIKNRNSDDRHAHISSTIKKDLAQRCSHRQGRT
jgi:hypothetical protein